MKQIKIYPDLQSYEHCQLKIYLERTMLTLTTRLLVYWLKSDFICHSLTMYWPKSLGPLSTSLMGLSWVRMLSAPEM